MADRAGWLMDITGRARAPMPDDGHAGYAAAVSKLLLVTEVRRNLDRRARASAHAG